MYQSRGKSIFNKKKLYKNKIHQHTIMYKTIPQKHNH